MMEKKILNKLVRDQIPELIQSEGNIPDFEKLSQQEFSKRLDEKLLEECQEVLGSKDKSDKIEEMADLLEILRAMAEQLGVTMDEVEVVRLKKLNERGGFRNQILLKSVSYKEK